MYKPFIVIPLLFIYEIYCSGNTQIPSSLPSNWNFNTPDNTPESTPTPPSTDNVSSRRIDEDNTSLPPANENFLNIGKNDKVGEYLSDTRGLALYAFELDGPNESKCVGPCTEKWTPLLVKGISFPPTVASKLDAKLVGLFDRGDGYQASYNKLPLYLYKPDRKQADIKGHKLKEFGGIWSLITPAGTIMDSRAAGLMKNLTNTQTMNFFSTGMASMVVIPDIYKMELNATVSQSSISAAEKAIASRIQALNRLNNVIVTLTNKNVKQNGQNYEVTHTFTITTNDPQTFSRLISAVSGAAFKIDFGVSDDLFSNTKANLYEMAVKDATDNANNLLNNFNLQIDDKNPIKGITIDYVNIQTINPVLNQSTLTYLPAFESATPNVASLKADINFNIKKKAS
jgi:predicted lipoprotein with Yx(FWY)xxD motif